MGSSTNYQRPVFNSRPPIMNNNFAVDSTNQLYRPSSQCSNVTSMEGKRACYAKYRALLESKGNHYNNGLRRHWHEENAHMQYILTTMGNTRQASDVAQQRVGNDFDMRNDTAVISNVKVENAVSPCDDIVPLNASTPSIARNPPSLQQPTQTDYPNFLNPQTSRVSSSLSVNSYLQSSNSMRQDTSYSSNLTSIDSNKSFTSQISGDFPSNASLTSLMTTNSAVSFETPSMSVSSVLHSSVPVSNSISPHSLMSHGSVRSSLVNSACSSPHSIPTNSNNVETSDNTDELLDFDLPEDLKNVNDDLFNCASIDNGALDLSISKLNDATDDLLNDLNDPSMQSCADNGTYGNLFSP